MYTFDCACGRKVTGLNLLAWQILCRLGKCQVCRANKMLERAKPFAVYALREYWGRKGLPEGVDLSAARRKPVA